MNIIRGGAARLQAYALITVFLTIAFRWMLESHVLIQILFSKEGLTANTASNRIILQLDSLWQCFTVTSYRSPLRNSTFFWIPQSNRVRFIIKEAPNKYKNPRGTEMVPARGVTSQPSQADSGLQVSAKTKNALQKLSQLDECFIVVSVFYHSFLY